MSSLGSLCADMSLSIDEMAFFCCFEKLLIAGFYRSVVSETSPSGMPSLGSPELYSCGLA